MSDSIFLFLKALANEERFEIVQLLLHHQTLYAKEIQKNFYLEQSTTSHHLSILKKANIVKTHKVGRHIYFSLNHKAIQAALHTLKTRLNTSKKLNT